MEGSQGESVKADQEIQFQPGHESVPNKIQDRHWFEQISFQKKMNSQMRPQSSAFRNLEGFMLMASKKNPPTAFPGLLDLTRGLAKTALGFEELRVTDVV